MKLTTICLSTVSLAAVLALSAAAVQDKKPQDPKAGGAKPAAAAPAQAMPEVKPGPEHAMLAKDAGSWDATVTSYETTPPTVTKATSTRRMVGDLWLVEDFVGSMGGKPFLGHGVMGFDQNKKKFVGVWVDSMLSSLTTSEGSYDTATKKMTCAAKMVMMGQESTSTLVTEYKDADNETLTMTMLGADGKQMNSMKIEYKRKK